MSKSEFFDFSPDFSLDINDKSDIDVTDDEDTVILCPLCINGIKMIPKPKEPYKIICIECGHQIDTKWEHILVEDTETTIEDISDRGTMTYKDDSLKQRVTANRLKYDLEEEPEYLKKEFSKYRQSKTVK